MRSTLPLTSYLFILRKHVWLVLGTVLVVGGVGYSYGKRQVPLFRASAQVELRSGGGAAAAGQASLFREDPVFIANQIGFLTHSFAAFRSLACSISGTTSTCGASGSLHDTIA